MINSKTNEKQHKPRLFELWDEIVNGNDEKEKNKNED